MINSNIIIKIVDYGKMLIRESKLFKQDSWELGYQHGVDNMILYIMHELGEQNIESEV